MIKITTVLAVAALALSACGSSNDTSSSKGDTSEGSSSSSSGGGYSKNASSSGSEDKGGSNEVEMYDYYFGPKKISGKPGSTVKIELKNEGKTEHNFKIDSQKSADADVEPGKTASVSVTIPKSGSVQFYCEYHKSRGMTGTVTAS